MNKTIFFIAVLCVSLTVPTQARIVKKATKAVSKTSVTAQKAISFTVTGQVKDATDGTKVYIAEVKGGKLVNTADSTVTQNGAFTIKGKCPAPGQAYLITSLNNRRVYIDFFLEGGNINVNIPSNVADESTVTGTTANNAYQAYKSKRIANMKDWSSIIKELRDTSITQQRKEQLMSKVNEIRQANSDAETACMESNMDNALGLYLLSRSYYSMDVDKLQTMLAKVPADLKSSSSYVAIQKFITNQMKTKVGNPYIDFTMQTPEGKTVKLSDYVGKGKYVLVDFWASWCGPCRAEMPNMVKAYAQFKDKNFEIVGVSLDQKAEAWKKAITDLGITWPQMSDLKYWDCEGAKLYGVSAIPATVLIDPSGKIAAKGLRGEALLTKLAELIK